MGVSDVDIPKVPEGEPEYTDSLLDNLHNVVKHTAKWLHYWGKNGIVAQHIVEYRLHMYLALATLADENVFFARHPMYGLMYIDDVPCFENLPNLWGIMHDTLRNVLYPRKKNINRNMLHILFTQALPCFHQTSKLIHVDEYVTVALNVVLALLLGLYKNVSRRVHFMTKVRFFKYIHMLMTSTREKQQAFFSKHPSLIILAFMEYIARVTPLFWPAEYDFLVQENNMLIFFEKIPLICDEFRVIDIDFTWELLEVQANLKIHKCSRARRLNKCDVVCVRRKRQSYDNMGIFLDCPVLGRNDGHHQHDISLLAHAYQIPLHVLQEGHSLIQVHDLASNIKKIQYDKMTQFYSCIRLRYMCSRMHVCVHCIYNKNNIHSKFRLNINTEKVVCSECLSDSVVSIDMMGRTVVILGETYILCPCCCKVHLFQLGNNNWIGECPLYQQLKKDDDTPNAKCDVCMDNHSHLVKHQRVNHLTGELEDIHFCYKHNPNDHALKHCMNMRQLKHIRIKRSSYLGKGTTKAIYDY